MKKIVALVLSLVMVLGLATTAFAAADTYDFYKADATLADALEDGVPSTLFKGVAMNVVPATVNTDGSGNVEYVVVNYNSNDYYYVKTTTPYTTSYAVTYKGEDDVLFYLDRVENATAASFEYEEEVVAFDKFSTYDKCGYVTVTQMPAVTDVYFETEDGDVYKAYDKVTAGAVNYLLNGKIVSAAAKQTVVDHYFVANNYTYNSTLKLNVPTSALCTKCMETSTVIYLDSKVPATLKPYELNSDKAYSVVVEDAPAVDTPAAGDKVESAETFDAGIAMYVGMSVMAAAGSAVVLKKKD